MSIAPPPAPTPPPPPPAGDPLADAAGKLADAAGGLTGTAKQFASMSLVVFGMIMFWFIMSWQHADIAKERDGFNAERQSWYAQNQQMWSSVNTLNANVAAQTNEINNLRNAVSSLNRTAGKMADQSREPVADVRPPKPVE